MHRDRELTRTVLRRLDLLTSPLGQGSREGWVPSPVPPPPPPSLAPPSAVPPTAGMWQPVTVAAGSEPTPDTPRTSAALRVASDAYTSSHGALQSRHPRRRVRWSVSWRLVAIAGAAVLLLAGSVALRAASAAPGAPVVLPVPAPDGTPTAEATADATLVVVDVVGAVSAQGVVRLPTGSRVVDAVAAAGGATADAEVSTLNMARVLVDGEQIVVPRHGQDAAAGDVPQEPSDDRVNLNTADEAALDALPGIGPVLAQRIVAHRDDGPYTSVDDLGDVSGIGPTLLDRLRELVRV